MENAQIAEIFEEIADLIELREGNPFRVRSYRNAAQAVRGLSERLERMRARGEDLSKIPNIGESTSKKIAEILDTGTCARLEALRKSVPSGLADVMRLPGLGPKKVMRLYEELGVESVADVKRACEAREVRELKGMGARTEEKLLRGIATVHATAGRMLYREAAEHLGSLSRHLNSLEAVKRWDVAGSFRRGTETIGDLDILVEAPDREAAADAVLGYAAVAEVVGRGREKVHVRLDGGSQADFRFFDPPAFGAALLYFTGSKAHNVKLRRLAQDRGWKLNEYGLFKGDRLLAGGSEAAVYGRMRMDWIPPELREDAGEIEAALEGRLPKLVERADVRGDFQSHTTASDGKSSIEDMARAARAGGLDYLAITDHTKRVTMANGLNDEQALKHADAIREVDSGMKRFWLLAGIEVDILKSGKLDLKEKTLAQLDWVVASVHYDRELGKEAMTDRIVKAVESGVVHCLGHPLGRIIGKREPLVVDLDRIVGACIDNDVWLEINAQPDRLDLPDIHCRRARDAGAQFAISTDAHSAEGLGVMPLGVTVARRGWLRKADVLNTKGIAELRKALRG
jgi:DNA polymerase (family X)